MYSLERPSGSEGFSMFVSHLLSIFRTKTFLGILDFSHVCCACCFIRFLIYTMLTLTL